MKQVGGRYPIHDAYEKVTGKAIYTTDLKLPGMLYAQMLFSPVAHAYIKSVDTSEAEAIEGVHYIAHTFNTTEKIFNSALRFVGHKMKPDEQIFPRKVRYVGDRVAAVVADTEEIALKAIKLIKVVYEELPFVIDVEEALKDDAEPIHEGGNLLNKIDVEVGDIKKAIEEADYVFEGRYTTPIVHQFAMEPHSCAANYDGKRLTVYTSSQNIFAYRVILSQLFEMPINRIRMIRPTVGGGFGGEYEMVLESITALLTLKVRKPVLLELSRKDSIVSCRTRHAAIVYLKVAVKKDGTIIGLDYKELVNAGAYASSTMNVIGGSSSKAMMMYRSPNIHYEGIGVYTNTPVGGAMRGYGSPQIQTPLELELDNIARQLNMDPIELRLRNHVIPGDINPLKKFSLGNCKVKECLEKGRELINWTEEVRVSEDGKFRTAIGCASGVHGNGVFGVTIDTTNITLKVTEDGSIILLTGTQDIGQGNVVMMRQIIAEVLQIEQDSIEVIDADTATTPFDMGTFSSRGTYVSGEAARLAGIELRDAILKEAAILLETNVSELDIDDGMIFNIYNPINKVSFADVAIHSQQISQNGEIIINKQYYSHQNPGSYCAGFAEVEVNMETYETKVKRYVAVHDIGKAINPLLVEGQIEGGIQMGLGYGLTEEYIFDDKTGVVTNAHAKKYKIFKAKDMPGITIGLIEEIEPYGPFGAKSIGEISTVAVGAAVVNGINRAIGTMVHDLPATPDRIRKAIELTKK